jgi:O-acetyl-ADP-ribose deacetylase (regulator of RNase III)
MKYNEIHGDLIQIAHQFKFDVITHGCNCHCTMGAGIAPQMAKAFGCNTFKMEGHEYKGDINKLGTIDYELLHFSAWDQRFQRYPDEGDEILHKMYVVNSYSQYNYGANHADGVARPLDYEALTLCLRKINKIFSGKKIGLPQIGSGLAGGNWNRIQSIIQQELRDCDVTVVIYKKS